MAQQKQVLIIDGHELFRAGFRHLISGIREPVELHEATSLEHARTEIIGAKIDLVLVDLVMADTLDVSAVTDAKTLFSGATVAVISAQENPLVIRSAIEHGAAGYIPKSSSYFCFVSALEMIIGGEAYVPIQALGPFNQLDMQAMRQATGSVAAASPCAEFEKLTDRQKATLSLAIKGFPNKKIATDLNISEGTVKAHLSAAFRIIGVSNRTEAVLRYAEKSAANF